MTAGRGDGQALERLPDKRFIKELDCGGGREHEEINQVPRVCVSGDVTWYGQSFSPNIETTAYCGLELCDDGYRAEMGSPLPLGLAGMPCTRNSRVNTPGNIFYFIQLSSFI